MGAEVQLQQSAPPPTVDSSAEADRPDAIRYVNMTMRNQPYSRVFNAMLMATQMQAKLEDGLVYVGPKVRETIIKSRFARTYRLNQVTASSAADYLANLGATVTKTQTRSTAITQEIRLLKSPTLQRQRPLILSLMFNLTVPVQAL